MDEKSLPDLLSNLIPDSNANNAEGKDRKTEVQDNVVIEGLEALAGGSGGALKTAIDEFLQGKGELHESTRTALAVDKKSAEKTIVEFLTTKFNLSPTLAAIIAPMLLKLIPGAEKKKRKTAVKPKKKPSTGVKQKTTSKKKKTTATTKKKKTSATKKPKKKTTR